MFLLQPAKRFNSKEESHRSSHLKVNTAKWGVSQQAALGVALWVAGAALLRGWCGSGTHHLRLQRLLPFELNNKWAAGWLAGWISVRPVRRPTVLLEVVGFTLQVLNQVLKLTDRPGWSPWPWLVCPPRASTFRQTLGCLSFLLLLLRSKAAVLLWIKAFWVNYSQEL